MADSQGFIPPHGGYMDLVSYQKAVIVYDATVQFCARYIGKRDRTHDQMVQAARSGKQNIIEGSMASAVSKKTEITLTNVARASLEELLEDYRDFLRSRRAPVWSKDSKEALYVRRLSREATPGPRKHGTYGTNETNRTTTADAAPSTDPAPSTDARPVPDASPVSHSSHPSHPSHSPYDIFRPFIETRPPEVAANIIICLIHQTNYLLDQQIRQLEKAFIEHGGLSEAMTRARLAERDKQRRRTP
jgi:four helix bundle suffix protein